MGSRNLSFNFFDISLPKKPDTAAALKQRGVSETLSFEADDAAIYDTIVRVIGTPGYKENVTKLSELMALHNDLAQSPLDRAIHLIELVTRTRGADHLKMGSRHLNLLQVKTSSNQEGTKFISL